MDLSQDIKLIALDLDGTLFNSQSVISKENIKAIKAASDAGVNIVISTGRPFCGDPFEQISGSGIDYSINANGSSAYRISTGECLFEDPLDDDVVIPSSNIFLPSVYTWMHLSKGRATLQLSV